MRTRSSITDSCWYYLMMILGSDLLFEPPYTVWWLQQPTSCI